MASDIPVQVLPPPQDIVGLEEPDDPLIESYGLNQRARLSPVCSDSQTTICGVACTLPMF